jgi:hypothetical protein
MAASAAGVEGQTEDSTPSRCARGWRATRCASCSTGRASPTTRRSTASTWRRTTRSIARSRTLSPPPSPSRRRLRRRQRLTRSAARPQRSSWARRARPRRLWRRRRLRRRRLRRRRRRRQRQRLHPRLRSRLRPRLRSCLRPAAPAAKDAYDGDPIGLFHNAWFYGKEARKKFRLTEAELNAVPGCPVATGGDYWPKAAVSVLSPLHVWM